MLPDWMTPHLKRAEALRKKARAAALAGDNAKAERLRDEMEQVYSALEANPGGPEPVNLEAVEACVYS